MSFLSIVYQKNLDENERNLRFWQNYLQNLKSLDFSIFHEKLKVATLVPVGSKIFFRGHLKHTNEIMVALGADYFTKCSVKQAEILRNHRIKDAESKVILYEKEREILENRITFTEKNILKSEGQEIIEYHTEEEDKIWRENHRQKVKEYKQSGAKEETKNSDITDNELWNRLEELELQEELENELQSLQARDCHKSVEAEHDIIKKEENDSSNKKLRKQLELLEETKDTFSQTGKHFNSLPKINLQEIIDKQNELGNRLLEIKNKEKQQTKTEQDLIARLDELDELDELEDEIEKLDDIIHDEIIEEDEITESSLLPTVGRKKSVSFIDEDDIETIELSFTHSDVEPSQAAYDLEQGIMKPSDIYIAYSNLFDSGTTAILKKPKFNKSECCETIDINVPKQEPVENRTVQIKDVVEKDSDFDKDEINTTRSMSLFKKRRQQMKSAK